MMYVSYKDKTFLAPISSALILRQVTVRVVKRSSHNLTTEVSILAETHSLKVLATI